LTFFGVPLSNYQGQMKDKSLLIIIPALVMAAIWRLVSFEVAQRLLKYQDTTKIKSLAKEICFYVLWLLRYKQKRVLLKIAFCRLCSKNRLKND